MTRYIKLKLQVEALSGTSSTLRPHSPNSDSDDDMAFSRWLFFQSKSTSAVKRKKTAAKSAKTNSKCNKGKDAPTPGAQDGNNATQYFLKQSQEKDEHFMPKMMEMEQQAREAQQKFSLDTLSMLGNIIKDIAKTKK